MEWRLKKCEEFGKRMKIYEKSVFNGRPQLDRLRHLTGRGRGRKPCICSKIPRSKGKVEKCCSQALIGI